METPESLVAANVAKIRDARGMSVRDLSAVLTKIGRPILPSGISKIENGQRGVSVGDLVALGVALGVNPNRLLLPDRADETPVALTPAVVAEAGDAWRWADGVHSLIYEGAADPPWLKDDEDWQRHARPAGVLARERHTAAKAARDVAMEIDEILRYPQPNPAWLEDGVRLPSWRRAPARLRAALERLRVEIAYLLESQDGR